MQLNRYILNKAFIKTLTLNEKIPEFSRVLYRVLCLVGPGYVYYIKGKKPFKGVDNCDDQKGLIAGVISLCRLE